MEPEEKAAAEKADADKAASEPPPVPPMPEITPDQQAYKDQFKYHQCYCDENIWLLSKQLCDTNRHSASDLYLVFVSNDAQTVPFFYGPDPLNDIYDYMAILLYMKKGDKEKYVYDLEPKKVPFPCPISNYLDHILRVTDIPHHYKRTFRVMPIEEYWSKYSSDRSHMVLGRTPEGEPIYNPKAPDYPPIIVEGIKNNVMTHFVDMKNKEIGTVLTHAQFLEFLKDDEEKDRIEKEKIEKEKEIEKVKEKETEKEKEKEEK